MCVRARARVGRAERQGRQHMVAAPRGRRGAAVETGVGQSGMQNGERTRGCRARSVESQRVGGCCGRGVANGWGSMQRARALEGGVEPPTLWLTATRSNQLSYSSCRRPLHRPGIEPGSVPWQGTILPLDHRCTQVAAAGDRTRVTRVTGGNTHHYTTNW